MAIYDLQREKKYISRAFVQNRENWILWARKYKQRVYHDYGCLSSIHTYYNILYIYTLGIWYYIYTIRRA